jgi:alpha-tubulin suppressor-like RCC1 family protein
MVDGVANMILSDKGRVYLMEKGKKFERIKIKKVKCEIKKLNNREQKEFDKIKMEVDSDEEEFSDIKMGDNLDNEEEFSDIKMGWGFYIFLTKKGEIYSRGWNKNGECGLGFHELDETKARIEIPQKIKFENKQKKIFTGEFGSFSFGENSQIYSWGLNDSLQIGQNEKKIYDKPTLLSLPKNSPKIKNISFLFYLF